MWAREKPPRSLVAALLAGAWDEDNDGDKVARERLAREPHGTIVAELAPLVGHLERPLGKLRTVWKVASNRKSNMRRMVAPAPCV